MKIWKLAILLIMVATSAACTVEKNSGLRLESFLTCEWNVENRQFSGAYDLLVASFLSPHDKYLVRPYMKNEREGIKYSSDQGNQALIKLTHFEVELELPIDWDPIEKYRIPYQASLDSGDELTGEFNLIPYHVRNAIEANYAKNAYRSLQPVSIARPEVNGVACNADNTDSTCLGYPCLKDDGTQAGWITIGEGDNRRTDPESGTCVNACTYWTGCSPGYVCDVGVGDFGVCRESCKTGTNTCKPLTNDAGNTLMEFECIRQMCVPSNATVNPQKFEKILAKITLKGRDVADDEISSQTMNYTLSVCRSCMISKSENSCLSTPLDPDSKDGWEKIMGEENKCQETNQDYSVYCGWLPGCYQEYCPDILRDNSEE